MLNLDARQHAIVVQILQRHIPTATVWAFGSRVSGGARLASDLDLAIVQPETLSQSILLDLKEDFDQSDLDIKVDVVLLQHLPALLQNQILLHHVIIQKDEQP